MVARQSVGVPIATRVSYHLLPHRVLFPPKELKWVARLDMALTHTSLRQSSAGVASCGEFHPANLANNGPESHSEKPILWDGNDLG